MGGDFRPDFLCSMKAIPPHSSLLLRLPVFCTPPSQPGFLLHSSAAENHMPSCVCFFPPMCTVLHVFPSNQLVTLAPWLGWESSLMAPPASYIYIYKRTHTFSLSFSLKSRFILVVHSPHQKEPPFLVSSHLERAL